MAEIDSEKRGPGKPSKYRPEHCERVIEMGLEGKSPVQMASALGVARTTLIDWRGQYEDFNEAMALALTHAQAVWEQIGFDSLHRKDFQGAAYTKLMQARYRHDYTERSELTGADGAPLMRPTTIQLIGVSPNRDDDEPANVIDIQANQPAETSALPEPAVELVAPSRVEEPIEPEPVRSAQELLRLFDAGGGADLTDAEERLLFKAIRKRAKQQEQAAIQAEEERVAKATRQRLTLPANIGARYKQVK